MTRAIILPFAAATVCIASCSTIGKVGETSVAFMKKTTAATTSKVSELSELAVNTVRPPGVKVVEVREEDLKELPSGREQALAYESKRKKSFWFFGGPVDFVEPTLPEAGGEMDGSLLPPMSP